MQYCSEAPLPLKSAARTTPVDGLHQVRDWLRAPCTTPAPVLSSAVVQCRAQYRSARPSPLRSEALTSSDWGQNAAADQRAAVKSAPGTASSTSIALATRSLQA